MTHTRASPFVTTRWTQVLAAQGDSEEARQALGDLCAAYYGPVVAFLGSEGRNEETARELAHEFFARVLERQSLGGADPERGRFRSYLLGALKHFLANRRAHELREKRGGGAAHEPLPDETDTALSAATTAPTSDAFFDRAWALSIIERALSTLRREATENGNLREFEIFKPWLTGESAARSQADAARELHINEGAARVAIHRLRQRFRELVKAEIAQTVNDPAEIAGEMRHLIEALT